LTVNHFDTKSHNVAAGQLFCTSTKDDRFLEIFRNKSFFHDNGSVNASSKLTFPVVK
jgi:hypothetical protein